MNKDFNWQQYLSNYPDLRSVGINNKQLALRHFRLHGITEGRTDKPIARAPPIQSPPEPAPPRIEYIEEEYYISLKIVGESVKIVIKPVYEEIIIVYHIYINPNKDWKSIVSGQISDIRDVGLLPFSKLYCIICTTSTNLFNECKNLINDVVNANYYHITVNNFEYPGIRKLHELGTIYPEKIFFYMHSKGMVFHRTPGRNNEEIKILRNTIKNWNYIKNLFNNNLFINKAGLFPDHSGVIWFNFFWIRGTFLKKLNPPIITSDRYYYEHNYINSNENDCFNLLRYDLSRITPRRACIILLKPEINNKHNFNWKKYISKYPDLAPLNDINKAYTHFKLYGIHEGRNLI
jgi:hypothetical protein